VQGALLDGRLVPQREALAEVLVRAPAGAALSATVMLVAEF
jgi:hypothetical protein